MIRAINQTAHARQGKTTAIANANGHKRAEAQALVAVETAADEVLTDNERTRLIEYENTIDNCAMAWLEMGRALVEINRDRLYRETHRTFEEYVIARFRIERSTAYQFIGAAKRYETALPYATKLRITFTAESQLRALRCQASELPAVLKLAAKSCETDESGNRIPTAKILTAAVEQVQGRCGAAAETPRIINGNVPTLALPAAIEIVADEPDAEEPTGPAGLGKSAESRSTAAPALDAAAIHAAALRIMPQWTKPELLEVLVSGLKLAKTLNWMMDVYALLNGSQNNGHKPLAKTVPTASRRFKATPDDDEEIV